MRAPEEAFLGKRSEERAEGELSREDRSRRRAAKKRRAGNKKLQEAATAKPAGDNMVGDGAAPPARLSGRKYEPAFSPLALNSISPLLQTSFSIFAMLNISYQLTQSLSIHTHFPFFCS